MKALAVPSLALAALLAGYAPPPAIHSGQPVKDRKAEPAPAPVVPPFVLPVTPVPPVPPPPAAPVNLVPGKPFVIRLNAAAVVASPAGMVKLCTKAEPVTIIDADGNDTTYSGDKSVCVVSAVAGKQGPAELILVSTADGTELARVQLNVGGAPPTPPVPPEPPTPPTPTDPFLATLQAAYSAETGATKANDVTQLAAFFDGAAKITANDPTLTTVGAFQSKFKNAVDSQIAATALPMVRAAIKANLTPLLPSSPAAVLDAPTRALIVQHYARIATDLEALK